MSAWSVKTRRAPSRHCSDARVYGYTTAAAHDNEYPPPNLHAVWFHLGRMLRQHGCFFEELCPSPKKRLVSETLKKVYLVPD